MQLTIKDLKNITRVIDNLNLTDSVESLCDKVKNLYNYPNGVRLIYSGRVIDITKNLSDYFKEDTNTFVVCMPENSKPPQTQTQAQVQVQVQVQAPTVQTQTQSVQAQSVQAQPESVGYSVEQIQATLILFMQFVRSSPDMLHMFCVDSQSLQNIMLSDLFVNTLLNPILSCTQPIVNAINSQTNISVSIPSFSNINSLFTNGQLSTFPPQSDSSAPTVPSAPSAPTVPSAPSAPSTPSAPSVPSAQTVPNPTYNDDDDDDDEDEDEDEDENKLNELDNLNIEELVSMGFTLETVTETYIMCNKSKEMTASVLVDML